MEFEGLIQRIENTHDAFYQQATKAINVNLTLRNYFIGIYIVEFEQNGKDRAKYGQQLLSSISKKIKIKGLTAPELSRCRQFYNVYPQLLTILSDDYKIFGSVTQKMKSDNNQQANQILGSPTQELEIFKNLLSVSQLRRTNITDDQENKHFVTLLKNTSFTHFVELIKIKDDTKRRFYELIILKTTPSVRELKRQISSLAFERVGLSQNIELAFQQLELKIGDFEQANAGQLNAYINYYKKNIQQQYDNPTVGILLVTDKNNALVEYATAGMDENLFVSKYLLQLPSKETLENFIKNELKDL